MNNDEYQKTIEVDGKVYRYDPDYDCYYRSHHQAPETERERWTKIGIALFLLLLIMIFSEYYFK